LACVLVSLVPLSASAQPEPVESATDTQAPEEQPAESQADETDQAPTGDGEGDDEDDEDDGDDEDDPFSVPDMPALTALDATASKIDRPASTKEISAALSNAYKDGALQSGVAVEVNARAFGYGKKLGYFKYRNDPFARALSNSALSFATSAAAAPDSMMMTTASDVRASIAARIVIWDQADPLLDKSYLASVDYAREACKDKPVAERTMCEANAQNEYSTWEDPRWNSGGAFLAAALVERFGEGKLKQDDFERVALWAAIGVGPTSWSHIALGASAELVDDADDTIRGSTRIRVGGKRIHATIDASISAKKPDADERGRIGVGLEFKVAENTWLTANASTPFGTPGADESTSLLSSIKWGSKPSW
jgi:hypothetical protein